MTQIVALLPKNNVSILPVYFFFTKTLCPVGGSDLLLEFDYSYRCVSFLRPNSDMKNNQGPLKSTIFKKL